MSLAAMTSGCVDIVANGAPRYVERDEKHFTTSGRPDVTVATFDGSIEIRAWDRSDVRIEIEKHAVSKADADDIEVRSEQNGNRVRVEARVRPANRFGFNMHRSARLIVSLPGASDVQATSGDGSIEIERVTGRMDLRSGDGSIRGVELSGDVTAQTGDGSIRFEDVDGDLDIATGDGSIVAAGKFAAVRARSGDGSVVIRAQSGSEANEDWTISTGDGSVTLELPRDFSAELDAHTGDGRVSMPGAMMRATEMTKRTVRGRIGDGGRTVRVRSGDGSITLRGISMN
jgi:DUF4097 and DUF4098 domain-containing protein YvlB